TEEISFSVSYSIFLTLVIYEPKEYGNSMYFDSVCYQNNSITNFKNGQIKLRVFYSIVKLMDFDFISANVNTVQNIQVSTSFITSSHYSDIDLITKNVKSTTFDPNSETVQIQKNKNKLSDLALSCLELTIVNNPQDEYIINNDMSNNLNQLCEQKSLYKQDIKGQKKKRSRRISKKIKK
ncbi:10476_t:CDS:2, partial [Cetraspora pellucida]